MEANCNTLNDELRRPTVGLTAHMADMALGLTAGPNMVKVWRGEERLAVQGERERALSNQRGLRQHAIDKVESRLASQFLLGGPRGPSSPARLDERASAGWMRMTGVPTPRLQRVRKESPVMGRKVKAAMLERVSRFGALRGGGVGAQAQKMAAWVARTANGARGALLRELY